jgi:glucose-1-phosphate cytidylyltransferase
MKVVILAGGYGTRMREETEFKPKPMVEVGGHPVLWHIMKNFAKFGHTDFVIAAGYKSEIIKDYFLNYKARTNDFTISLGNRESLVIHGQDNEDWNVTVADTGVSTLTGGRLLGVSKYLDPKQDFLVAYGDGLANIDIDKLVASHRASHKIATLTVVQPQSRFGLVDIDSNNAVTKFREKPQVEGWINVGFFVMNQKVLGYIDPEGPLEQEPLSNLASDGELNAFRHEGFWQPMDTYREAQQLNELWNSGNAPWKSW